MKPAQQLQSRRYLPKQSSITTMSAKSHLCKTCYKSFEAASLLERHVEMHRPKSAENQHTCPKCPASYRQKTSLQKHMRKRHSQATEKVIFICSLCARPMSEYSVMRVHLIKIHEMDPAEARRKARAMTHNLIPQTGLNLIKLAFIDIIISLDEQRMSKKQREQKMEVGVLSLSSNSSADDSKQSPSSNDSDTSPIKQRLRTSTKRRHIFFRDDDDSQSDNSSQPKQKRTPDSDSRQAKGGEGFDSDALEFENEDSSRSFQVLKPPKQLQQILMHVCSSNPYLPFKLKYYSGTMQRCRTFLRTPTTTTTTTTQSNQQHHHQ